MFALKLMVEEENDNHYDKKISPTDLYASLVANVTQASMLMMLLYLSTLKLPVVLVILVFLTFLMASS